MFHFSLFLNRNLTLSEIILANEAKLNLVQLQH